MRCSGVRRRRCLAFAWLNREARKRVRRPLLRRERAPSTRERLRCRARRKAAAVAFLNAKVAEVEAIRRGVIPRTTERPTVAELVERFLKLHDVDQATTRKLRAQLRHAVGRFGTERPNELRQLDLELWRKTLSPGVQHDAFRAFRQALSPGPSQRNSRHANASVGIKNPKRKRHERREIVPFESWDDVDAIAG